MAGSSDKRADLGITSHVIEHLLGAMPQLNHVLSHAHCEAMEAKERVALMFSLTSYFFDAAVRAKHVCDGGIEGLPIPPDLIRSLGTELAERYNEAVEAGRRARS